MKIALLGYGRMGREIEKIALQRGHDICAKINDVQDWTNQHNQLLQADVAIEFSQPEFALENIRKCFNLKLPVVVGTTGWYEELENIKKEVNDLQYSLFFASNFSLGVNIFFEINKKLAGLMSQHSQYNCSMEETHHIHKLDEPSGTAESLAAQIIENNQNYQNWTLDQANPDQIHIDSIREGEVPGTHRIFYKSDIDEIEISHRAKGRQGFATGAVLAAEYLKGKSGFYEMKDLLGL